MAFVLKLNVDNFTGCLVGLACGDALGGPVEEIPSHPTQTLRPVSEMVGGGFFNLMPGQITDDTDMAICLAESLVTNNGLNPEDVAKRWEQWFFDNPIGTGKTIEAAMHRLREGISWAEAGYSPAGVKSLGNGSVMRCAPVALQNVNKQNQLINDSIQQSLITHPHDACCQSAVFINTLIAELIRNKDADFERQTRGWLDLPHVDIKHLAFRVALGTLTDHSAITNYAAIPWINITEVAKQYKMGSVYQTVTLAVRVFLSTPTFEEAVITTANLGGDADTIAAVTGAIAGAHYGEKEIPERWKSKLIDRHSVPVYERLCSLGNQLYKNANV